MNFLDKIFIKISPISNQKLSGKNWLAAAFCLLLASQNFAQTFPGGGFTLPNGKTIVITYDVDVNANIPLGTCQISTQAAVSGSNFTTVSTDDPDVAGANNPTTTTRNHAPSISTCPSSVSIGTNTGQCTATHSFVTTVLACPSSTTFTYKIGSTTITSPHAFPKGTSVVDVTASNGISPNATCQFTVTVNDNQAPTVTCPGTQNLNTDPGVCTTTYSISDPLTDNCTGATWGIFFSGNTNGNPGNSLNIPDGTNGGTFTFQKGTTLVQFVGTDAASNNAIHCNFNVVVADNQAPTIACPANTIVAANASCQGMVGSFSLISKMDNCTASGSISESQSPSSSTILTGHNATQIVTLTATDASSNTATCSFSVTLKDQTQPTITCPANQIVVANGSCTGTVGTWSAVAAGDNCGSVSVSQFPIAGTVLSGHDDFETITLTANDGNGNTATCSFSVTLKDQTPPTITCPANQIVAANPSCAGIVGSWGASSSSDNCGSVSISQMPAGNTALSGHDDSEIVTLTVTDGATNTATCSFSVTLKDQTAPAAPASLPDVNGICSANPTAPTASDNCEGTITATTTTSFPVTAIGTTTVTWVFTDTRDNSSTVTQNVVIVCDQDNDGFNPPADCNDLDNTIYPGAPELCDSKDNDCDLAVDEGVIATSFTTSQPTCFGNSNGTIFTTVGGTNTPFTFLWDNGKTTQNINLLAAATYTLTTTDALGCQNINSTTLGQPAAITFSVNFVANAPGYDANFTTGGGTGSFTFNRTGMASGDFRVASDPIFDHLPANTSFIFKARDANGCQKSVIKKTPATAPLPGKQIHSFEKTVGDGSGIFVFPNPTAGVLNVEFLSEEKTSGTISVVNLLGSTVFAEKINLAEGEIFTADIQKLPTGNYFLMFQNGGEVQSARFSVE